MSDAKPSIDSFAEVILSPTLPRFVALSIVLLMLFFGFHYLEAQTEYFADQHATNEVELLKKLIELRTSQTLTADEEEVRSQAISRMMDQIDSVAVDPKAAKSAVDEQGTFSTWREFSFPGDKFLFGLLPWLSLAAASWFGDKNTGDRIRIVSGMGVMACISGTVATLLPFEDVVYKALAPWVISVAAMALMVVFAFSMAGKNQRNSATHRDPSSPDGESESGD